MSSSPYELLAGLALLRERKRLVGYSSDKYLESWPALLVRMGETICVLRQNDVDEIIARGQLSRINGVADWVIGLGYFRGQLLTVLDGPHLLGLRSAKHSVAATARVMVMSGGDEWFGLQVDELIGIRHVWSDHMDVAWPRTSVISAANITRPDYVERWIKLEDNIVPVLKVQQLVEELAQKGEAAANSDKLSGDVKKRRRKTITKP